MNPFRLQRWLLINKFVQYGHFGTHYILPITTVPEDPSSSGGGADSPGANESGRDRPFQRQKSLFSDPMTSIQATQSIDEHQESGIPASNVQGDRLLVFVGVIDILQSYRTLKKLEHAWKSIWHDGDTISVHRPGFYANRFEEFMRDKVFTRLQAQSPFLGINSFERPVMAY